MFWINCYGLFIKVMICGAHFGIYDRSQLPSERLILPCVKCVWFYRSDVEPLRAASREAFLTSVGSEFIEPVLLLRSSIVGISWDKRKPAFLPSTGLFFVAARSFDLVPPLSVQLTCLDCRGENSEPS